MPTCGSRPICSRSRWSRSAFPKRPAPGFRRAIALAGLAFFLVRTGGHDDQHVALRPRLRPRARRARPRPARRADGELRRPAAASSPGRCRACSICPAWRSSAATLSRTTNGRWPARNCSTSATGPAGRSSATRPRSSPPAAAAREVWRPIDAGARHLPARRVRLCLADLAAALRSPSSSQGLRPIWRERNERALPGRKQCEQRHAGGERHPPDQVTLEAEDLLRTARLSGAGGILSSLDVLPSKLAGDPHRGGERKEQAVEIADLIRP